MQANIDELIQRVERLECENARLREDKSPSRRLHLPLALALVAGVVCLLMPPANRKAIAQGNGVEGRVSALEKAVTTLTANLNAETARAQAAENALRSAITHIALIPGPAGPQGVAGPAGPAGPTGASPFVLSEDGTTWVLSGYNLQIVSGSGATDDNIFDGGTLTGRGNLIVGYNAVTNFIGGEARTGSHNLIVGDGHGYTSYGGVVAGYENYLAGPYATITGGQQNQANTYFATVSGGARNSANGDSSTVGGGYFNEARGFGASASGGEGNNAFGEVCWVGGGNGNVAFGLAASVSGGAENQAVGDLASVSGGYYNKASGRLSWVAGGMYHEVTAPYSSFP